MSRKGYRKRYSLFKGWRLDKLLFVRLIRFGLPSGVQFFLDTAGFTIFVLLIGRLGTNELAASNIAMNINSLAFMPMLGVGISVSILVGQYLGKKTPHIAERSAYSGFHISLIYITLIVFSFLFAPDIFVLPFASKTNEANFESIREITLILIRFIAVYSVFDMFNIVFASAIKGAGDTRFVMNMIVLLSFTLLVLPSYFTIVVLDAGIYAGWTIASTYIIALGLVFFRRFRGGKWKSMSVIEEHSKAE